MNEHELWLVGVEFPREYDEGFQKEFSEHEKKEVHASLRCAGCIPMNPSLYYIAGEADAVRALAEVWQEKGVSVEIFAMKTDGTGKDWVERSQYRFLVETLKSGTNEQRSEVLIMLSEMEERIGEERMNAVAAMHHGDIMAMARTERQKRGVVFRPRHSVYEVTFSKTYTVSASTSDDALNHSVETITQEILDGFADISNCNTSRFMREYFEKHVEKKRDENAE